MPEPQKRLHTARDSPTPGIEPMPVAHKSGSLARDQSRTADIHVSACSVHV